MLTKSPSGSLCPYYYMGGELHPLKYGSYHLDREGLFCVMKAEEEFILRSSGMRNRRIWVDLYETELDDEVCEMLSYHILAIRDKIFKLCFVGCSFGDIRRLLKHMRERVPDQAGQARFFSDPEDAKKWLVGE